MNTAKIKTLVNGKEVPAGWSSWKRSDKFTYMIQPENQADNSPIFQTKLKAWKYLVKYENGAL
jgi:hypothetical protein